MTNPFIKWVKETYGVIISPAEMEEYLKTLRDLNPTEIIVQTPRGYYIPKEPPSQ